VALSCAGLVITDFQKYCKLGKIGWLRERTKYVPLLRNRENHSWSQGRGRKLAIISSCSLFWLLPAEIVMHDAFYVINWTSTNHARRSRKNRTARYNCRFSATSLALRVIFGSRKRPPIYVSYMMILRGRTEQHIIIGFGELVAVDYNT